MDSNVNLNPGQIMQEKDRDSLLLKSCRYGNVTEIRSFLLYGANANTKEKNSGTTPLMYAAQYNYKEIANLLIEHGAIKSINETDRDGETALMISARHGHTDMGLFLISLGANLTIAKKNEEDALSIAARHGHTNFVNILLQHGMFSQKSIKTALLLAAEYNYTDTVCRLFCTMTQEELNQFIDENPVLSKFIPEYSNTILSKRHSLFQIFGPLLKQETNTECYLLNLPIELLTTLFSLRFTGWYTFRLHTDLSLTLNTIQNMTNNQNIQIQPLGNNPKPVLFSNIQLDSTVTPELNSTINEQLPIKYLSISK